MEVLKDYPKEFAKLFGPSFNCLRLINVKFLVKDEGFLRKYWRCLFIMPCVLLNYLSLSWMIYQTIAERDLSKIAYLAPPYLIFTRGIIKAIVVIPKQDLISTVIEELGAVWRKYGLTDAQNKTRQSFIKKIHICNTVIYWRVVIATLYYIATPLVETVVKRILFDQDCELQLPMKSAFPFDPTGHWAVYLAVYAFQVYCFCLFVAVYVGSELMMVTLSAFLYIEFEMLCDDLHEVKAPKKWKQNNITTRVTDDYEKWTLRDIIQHHQKLCILSDKFDDAFNQMAFTDLMFVGITTCFFRYAAQFAQGMLDRMNYYMAVAFALVRVLYWCYIGELHARASMNIGDMTYDSLWYEGDENYKKSILIIIMRSQKPCCLTSMKYAPLTLNMFTKVMSTTWSYLSLMNTVYEDSN